MSSRNVLRRLGFLQSMKLGIFLLMLIMVLSVIGTILPQGREASFYTQKGSSLITDLILNLGLDHLYSSLLFAVLFSALAVNMLLCNTTRLGFIIKKLKHRHDINTMKEIRTYIVGQKDDMQKALGNIFYGYGGSRSFKSRPKEGIYYSSKNVLGYFGSWFLHLGVMLVILFYIYGQATYYSQELYGIPREIRSLRGTDFKAIIRDFKISYREDDSIEQYTTQLDLLDSNNKIIKNGSSSVNNPMRYKGYSFYQTSTGWAAECNAYKAAVPIRAQVIYEGLVLNIPEENIAIAMTKFYPDFAANDSGFFTLSDKPNNPAILYGLYYMGEIVKMDIIKPGEKIQWNDYEFVMDKVQRYTYLQVNKMNGSLGAAAGGLLIVLGLLLVFYFKPRELVVLQQEGMLRIFRKTDDVSSEDYVSTKFIKGNIKEKEEGSINVR